MTRPTHPATSGDDVRRTIDDVLSALDLVIERARDTGDAAGYFAVVYRKVTASVKEGPELDHLRRDFDRINAILAAMIGTIQDDLRRISPWMGLLDRIGARTQTEIVRFSIVTARAGAWRFAQRLAVSAEDEWQAAIADRDRRVADVGRRVLHPGPWMSSGLVLVRVRERGDVRANLDVLLGVRPPSLAEVEATLEGGPRFA
jgi:hypothetical protein